uniref:Uncharacterized protein n=1 Tax=mine drainage metagenome TaxID=410659 RepID=E6QWQ3_9ZZZZ
MPKMEINRRSGEHPIEAWIGEKRADLVLNWRDGFLGVSRIVAGKFFDPERDDLLILHPGEHCSLKRFIREHTQNIGKRRVSEFDECVERVSKDVLHADTPRFTPQFLERLHEPGSRDRYSMRPYSS